MTDITSLSMKTLLANAIQDIFDTMLSMSVEMIGKDFEIMKDNNRVVGSVGFAGGVTGCMNIHLTEAFARIIAGNMLGEDPEDIQSEDIRDVVGELSNMIGGALKSRICDNGTNCSLSIPTTMTGEDFTIESHGWSLHESVNFYNNKYIASVEVYLKPNESP